MSKRTWAYIRAKGKDNTGIPPLKSHEGDFIVYDDTSKANALSHQYKEVFTKEDLTYIPPTENPLSSVPDINITLNGVEKLLGKPQESHWFRPSAYHHTERS